MTKPSHNLTKQSLKNRTRLLKKTKNEKIARNESIKIIASRQNGIRVKRVFETKS